MSRMNCFECGGAGETMHGYVICEACKSKLGLFTDEKIHEHMMRYAEEGKSYADEIRFRLDAVEKDYIKKKLKLLYIQDRLTQIR